MVGQASVMSVFISDPFFKVVLWAGACEVDTYVTYVSVVDGEEESAFTGRGVTCGELILVTPMTLAELNNK